MPDWDAVIIGGGPAGLTAAIYLGRFRRQALVIDDGTGRAERIPKTHNHPGFPGGIEGDTLVARIREQAAEYGANFLKACVTDLKREDAGFLLETSQGEIRAPFVILASGSKDNDPALPGVESAVDRGLIRLCPICDAYEVIGKRIGILGNGPKGVREAQFLTTYSDDVTLIHLDPENPLSPDDKSTLEREGIALMESVIDAVHIENDAIEAFDIGGEEHRFDVIYGALGLTPRSELAHRAGAATTDDACMKVNAHQETSVSGLYAAGDLVLGLNQISIAQAEGAIAATDIHNKLRAMEREDGRIREPLPDECPPQKAG
ncbi:Thioredoxin reductase [Methyloligella halotolerans]|uniref:Thioredoxin reductase n=2 Tax=Methyloligella halotolerans TaxID=1177755 RepID=A0A1E2S0B8_9HYPH|nr:Thioredoxin reductase [Methyloligella halotolerans]